MPESGALFLKGPSLAEVLMDITELEQIVKILRQNDVTDFELVQGGTSIKLSRVKPGASVPAPVYAACVETAALSQPAYAAAAPVQLEAPQTSPVALQPVEDDSRYTKVPSPIVGTFYRKPSPDAEPFVKEGDHVKKGQTLCIVEAMKLMNEIEAPCSGKIHKACLNDGQVVEFGEIIFWIEAN